jgi:hypothetical protein
MQELCLALNQYEITGDADVITFLHEVWPTEAKIDWAKTRYRRQNDNWYGYVFRDNTVIVYTSRWRVEYAPVA